MDQHHELFEDESGIVKEQVWQSRIEELKNSIVPSSVFDLDQAIRKAVASRSKRPLALLFSGGVDSSLLALLLKQGSASFTAYSVGIEKSQDLGAAMAVAEELQIPLKTRVLSLETVQEIIEKLPSALQEARFKDQNLSVLFGVASVEWAGIEMARENGYQAIMGGLGSEEIFAGYERHAKAADINAECWSGLSTMWAKDLVRDASLAKAMNVTVLTPFLDRDLIKVAMGISGDLKIKAGIKKACLRDAAVRMGLPQAFADRKKMAAQYGSGIDKAIERIAKKQGFNSKHKFLDNLASRCEPLK